MRRDFFGDGQPFSLRLSMAAATRRLLGLGDLKDAPLDLIRVG
jgi:hypothetical protein